MVNATGAGTHVLISLVLSSKPQSVEALSRMYATVPLERVRYQAIFSLAHSVFCRLNWAKKVGKSHQSKIRTSVTKIPTRMRILAREVWGEVSIGVWNKVDISALF